MIDDDELDAIARRSAGAVRSAAGRLADTQRARDQVRTKVRRPRLLWPLIAAAVLATAVAGVIVLRSRDGATSRIATIDSSLSSTQSVPTQTAEPTSVTTTAPAPTTADGPSTMEPLPPTTRCDTAPAPTSLPDEGLYTFHTMAPAPPTLEYTLTATPNHRLPRRHR
jgi:hypothetical protein